MEAIIERAISGEISADEPGHEMAASVSTFVTHVGDTGFSGISNCFHVAAGGGLGEVGGHLRT